MPNYKLTRKSINDLSDIWNYTFDNWSENQADSYYNKILSDCQAIADNPELGKNYEKIIESLFGYKTGKHIIFYRRITNNSVEITRILHSQMDLRNRIIE